MEALLIQVLGNTPVLVAVLFVYYRLERRIYKLENNFDLVKRRCPRCRTIL